MAIQPNKPQNRVFLLVGVVLAAAAALAVLFAISRTSSNTPTTNVVVAKTTISAGTSISSDMLTTTALAQGTFPVDVYTDPAQVVGKTAPVTLSQNTPLYTSLFVSANPGVPGQPVIAHLDITKGYVALAIPATSGVAGGGSSAELTSIGFYIQPEDHIDILVDPGLPGQPGVRYSFQDVRVLRVGASGATGSAVASYIIELPRSQAEIMTALSIPGRTGGPVVLKYVLRPQNEWGKRDGANGFDKPVYEASTAAPLTTGADSGVTAASLNALFAAH